MAQGHNRVTVIATAVGSIATRENELLIVILLLLYFHFYTLVPKSGR